MTGSAVEDDDAAQETAGLIAVRDAVATLGGTLDAGPREERGYWVLAQAALRARVGLSATGFTGTRLRPVGWRARTTRTRRSR